MLSVLHTSTTTVTYANDGAPLTLKEIADFVQECYHNGFTTECIPVGAYDAAYGLTALSLKRNT